MSLTLSELTAKTSSLAKTNLVSKIVQSYKNFEEISDMKLLYKYRNEPKVVDPFLLAIKADYRKLPGDVIVVLWEEQLVDELKRLGFSDVNIALPDTKYFNKEIKVTEGLSKNRLYNVNFNIDLHLMSVGRYSLMKDAQCILNDLSTPEEVYVRQLINCMISMSNITCKKYYK